MDAEGGVGGVPQSVGKEFASADPGGKLPKSAKPSKPSFKMAELGRKK